MSTTGRLAGWFGLASVPVACLAASCAPQGPADFAVRTDSLLRVLMNTDTGASGPPAPQRMCAGSGDSLGSGRDAEGPGPRLRDRLRGELEGMGFSSCTRVLSRTIQTDSVLRRAHFTELVAWRNADLDTAGLIHVPVHYRTPSRHSPPPRTDVDSAAVRPAATVLAAVEVLVADTTCKDSDGSAVGCPRKGLVLSFTDLAEWEEWSEPWGTDSSPAAGGSRYEISVRGGDGAGLRPRRVVRTRPGWAVGQIAPGGGWPATPSPARLPEPLPETGVRLPADPPCRNWEPCEAILPGTPAIHVHEVFTPEHDSWDEVDLLGPRTVAVLRAADATPYGKELPATHWWGLQGWVLMAALVGVIICLFCSAVLGTVDKAIGIARWDLTWAWMAGCLAGIRRAVLLVPLAWRNLAARFLARGGGRETAEACAELDRLERAAAVAVRGRVEASVGESAGPRFDERFDQIDKALSRVRRWMEAGEEWARAKDILLHAAEANQLPPLPENGGGSHAENNSAEKGMSSGDGGRGTSPDEFDQRRWERLDQRAKLAKEKWEGLETDVRDSRTKADGLASRARDLAKEFKSLGRTARRQPKRDGGSAEDTELDRARPAAAVIDAIEALPKALRKAGNAVRRDARALTARERQQSILTRRCLCKKEAERYGVAGEALERLLDRLRKLREEKEKYAASGLLGSVEAFSRLGALFWLRRDPPVWVGSLCATVLVLVGLVQWGLGYWPVWPFLVAAAGVMALGVLLGLFRRARRGREHRKDASGEEGKMRVRQKIGFAIVLLATLGHALALQLDDVGVAGFAECAGLGVDEGVWGLVHVSVVVMVFLAAALHSRKYSIGQEYEEHLQYWRSKVRKRTEEFSSVSVRLARTLRHQSHWAVSLHFILLVCVAAIGTWHWGLWITDALPPSVLSALRALGAPGGSSWLLLGLLVLFFFVLPTLLVNLELPSDSAAGAGSTRRSKSGKGGPS